MVDPLGAMPSCSIVRAYLDFPCVSDEERTLLDFVEYDGPPP